MPVPYTKTKTQSFKGPAYAIYIFFESIGFKNIKYDICVCQIKNTQIRKVPERPNIYATEGYQIIHLHGVDGQGHGGHWTWIILWTFEHLV